MSNFIQVTDLAGTKRLINTAWIEEVWDTDDGATIYFAFNCPNAIDQDSLRVKESYAEIKDRIFGVYSVDFGKLETRCEDGKVD